MKRSEGIVATLLLMIACQLLATASVPSLNDCPDMIFIEAMENNSVPSNGFGGTYPGTVTRTIGVDTTFYIFIPSSYQPTEPMPLMAVWHGAVFSGGGPAAALDMINYWQVEAENNDFIVVAQAAIGSEDCEVCGWIPGPDSQILSAIFDDMELRYNIETTRRYVWGFSAGGNVMHAIALNSADYFAGYAISGADLGFAVSAGYTPANALRTLPVYISVGQSDPYYPNPQTDVAIFSQAGWDLGQNLWLDDFVGGHELLSDLPEKAWDKICISTILD